MCADIVAIGGGGFSEGSEPGIDEYLLTLCDAPRPAIGFIATASGDADRYLVKFYSQFSRLDCHPSHLPLFARTPDIGDWLQRQDIVFVGGGNTKSMLAVWDAWNLPQLLKTALDAGKVLAGISAGAICWFDAGVTDSFEGRLQALDCLGFISGSCCPHYRLEIERKPAYEHMIASGEIAPGCAIDDGAAVHFVNGQARYVVSGAEGASAYRVSIRQGQAVTGKVPGTQQIDV